MHFGVSKSLTHSVAAADDASIARAIGQPLARILGEDRAGNLWMSLDTYIEAPLRERDSLRLELTLVEEQENTFSVVDEVVGDIGERAITPPRGRVANDWLALTDDELRTLAEEYQVDVGQALTVSLASYSRDGTDVIQQVRRHRSFGFWIAPRNPH